jgi:hypothetical protein
MPKVAMLTHFIYPLINVKKIILMQKEKFTQFSMDIYYSKFFFNLGVICVNLQTIL